MCLFFLGGGEWVGWCLVDGDGHVVVHRLRLGVAYRCLVVFLWGGCSFFFGGGNEWGRWCLVFGGGVWQVWLIFMGKLLYTVFSSG